MPEESVTIVLKPEDDTETILEKIRTAGVQQVNLIVPPGTKALQMLGGFTMLRKACDITGIDVTIYSIDEKTCDMAKVCRFDVVRLEPEGRPQEVRPVAEELPRIVVSTRPPQPAREMAAPGPTAGALAAEKPAPMDERLRGLSDDDMALFDALESMSGGEDVVLGPETFGRPAGAAATAAAEVGEEPAAVPERRPRKTSPLANILSPLTSALGNLYIAVVGVFLKAASKRVGNERKGAAAEAPAGAAVAPLVPAEEDVHVLRAQKRRYYIWGLVGVVAFTLFILALYAFSIPRTVVSLTPLQAPPQEIDLALTLELTKTVSPDGAKVAPGEGGTVAIPAQAEQVELSGRATGQATGEAMVAEQAAEGPVIFSNLTGYDVYIPVGTRVSGGGATFHTTQDVTLAASDFWGSDAHVETLEVWIQADQPGSAGNVDAWTIGTIEGDLAGVLTVVNEVATSGGLERKGTIVTAGDLEKLRQKLVTGLREQAYSDLQKKIGKLEVLSGTLEIETVEETFSHAVGAEATTITLTARVRASALASAPGLLNQAIDKAVLDKLGGQKTGQQIAKIAHGEMIPVAPTGTGSAWTYRTHATVSVVNSIDPKLQAEIRQALRGCTYAEARQKLEKYRDRIASYAISPVLGRLPRPASRIRVEDISQYLH